MRKHVTVVGAIHIDLDYLVLSVHLLFSFTQFAKGFVSGEEIPTIVLGFLAASLPLLIGFLSTLGLVGGIGLIALKSWARYLIIVVAALGCLNIPIGTLKGVYSLWVLLQDDAIKLFNNN